MNYYTDYYNSPLNQFFKSGHISRCQSTAYKSYNKCDRLATVANCVLTHTHQSFKKWLLMGGPKKGIHHFLKWPPLATMPGGLYYLQGFVRIAGQFIKCILVLLFYEFFFFYFILQKILEKLSNILSEGFLVIKCVIVSEHTSLPA